jgi:hypothetical protein
VNELKRRSALPYPAPVDDHELVPFGDVDWPSVNHRVARDWLETRGWTLSGVGDWARVFASPERRFAARVSPFEPSYGWFVELCRRADGNPYFPGFHLVTELAGGGQLAVMDLLSPVGEADERDFLQRWNDEHDADVDLRAARTALDTLDAECRTTVPFWMGVDLGDHLMRTADGHLQLIDLVGLSGDAMTELLGTDPEAFHRLIPRDRCRYMVDIPYFDRPENSAERARVLRALAAPEPPTTS